MARPKKHTSMKEEIVKQEEVVEKSEAKYDAEVKKLKDMYAKREKARQKALLDAVEESSNSYMKRSWLDRRIKRYAREL